MSDLNHRHPSGVECITLTEHLNFCIGSAVECLWRAGDSDRVEDLQQAVWYVNREIERRSRQRPSQALVPRKSVVITTTPHDLP